MAEHVQAVALGEVAQHAHAAHRVAHSIQPRTERADAEEAGVEPPPADLSKADASKLIDEMREKAGVASH